MCAISKLPGIFFHAAPDAAVVHGRVVRRPLLVEPGRILVMRMAFDHFHHPHDLYVGFNHGVTLLRPDSYRPVKPGDLRRDRILKLLGWTLLYFTWDDVHLSPQKVEADYTYREIAALTCGARGSVIVTEHDTIHVDAHPCERGACAASISTATRPCSPAVRERSFAPAVLEDPLGEAAWTGWRFEWDAQPGEHVLCSRATDAAGNAQPLDPAWNLKGYANNAVERIRVVAGS